MHHLVFWGGRGGVLVLLALYVWVSLVVGALESDHTVLSGYCAVVSNYPIHWGTVVQSDELK